MNKKVVNSKLIFTITLFVSKGRNNKVTKLHGNFVHGSHGDVGVIPASLDPRAALKQMQELHKKKDLGATWNFSNEKAGTSSGWNTKMAFDIFTKANMDYWTPSTNFQQGAEGAMNAAVDYGYPCQDVVNAFAQVGITIVCPGPPVADFSALPVSGGVPLTTTFTDLSQAASS